MKKQKWSWKLTTLTIPQGAEVVCENAVSEDGITFGGALVRFKATGMFALVKAGTVQTCDQREAKKIAEGKE